MPERIARALLLLFAALGGLAAAGWIGTDWLQIRLSPFALPQSDAWAGANALGQDLGARWLQALASLWRMALPACLLGLFVALLIALLASGRGLLAAAARLLIDLADSVPALLVVLALMLALQGWWWGSFIALAWCLWPESVRMLEVELRRVRRAEFWQAARLTGAGPWRTLRVQLLPLLWPMLRDQSALLLLLAIKTEVALNFIGIHTGHTVSLGGLLAEGLGAIAQGYWWPMLLPCFTLILLMFAATAIRPRNFQSSSRIE